jgi:hypothetical protein
MCDIDRDAKSNATISITVPYFSNVYGFSYPTQVRFFGLYSMLYFVAPDCQPLSRKVPWFCTFVKFHVRSIRIDFYDATLLDKTGGTDAFPHFSKLKNFMNVGFDPSLRCQAQRAAFVRLLFRLGLADAAGGTPWPIGFLNGLLLGWVATGARVP